MKQSRAQTGQSERRTAVGVRVKDGVELQLERLLLWSLRGACSLPTSSQARQCNDGAEIPAALRAHMLHVKHDLKHLWR